MSRKNDPSLTEIYDVLVGLSNEIYDKEMKARRDVDKKLQSDYSNLRNTAVAAIRNVMLENPTIKEVRIETYYSMEYGDGQGAVELRTDSTKGKFEDLYNFRHTNYYHELRSVFAGIRCVSPKLFGSRKTTTISLAKISSKENASVTS